MLKMGLSLSIPEESMKKLIKDIDTNNDGKIQLEEWLN